MNLGAHPKTGSKLTLDFPMNDMLVNLLPRSVLKHPSKGKALETFEYGAYKCKGL